MARTVALAGIAAFVVAADWLRFEDPRSGGGKPFVLAVLAIAPVLLRPLWLRAGGLVVSLLLAGWVALSVSPLRLWPGGAAYFEPLGSRFKDGFLDFYEFRLPIQPERHPRMHAVILVAIFAFVLLIALAVAARRALPAVIVFLVGAGWPATLLTGGNELGRGIVILAVALALLAGLAERPSRLAVGAAGMVLVGALALSSSPAVAKTAFLNWQQWDPYTKPEHAVSVRYVWDARYTGIRFPSKRTTVLTIRGPSRSQYWRATVLDRFDGTRWLEHPWRATPVESSRLLPAGARKRKDWVRQDVTVGALDDDHLVGASIPVAFALDEVAVQAGQQVALVPGGLIRGGHYTAWSYAPEPTPAQVARVPAVYPRALTEPGRELDLARGVTVPAFGVPRREATVSRLLTGRLRPYARVYDRAREVAGRTASPYAAAVALEAWLRNTGGFTYSEQPASVPGVPPLVGFVLVTKSGYCQHFAGAMALMLRLLGIPARVAAGFAPGHYRDGTWTVSDHDAHAWVEVWFRGYGWLPFDPTPGRGRLSGTYSSTALGFNAQAAAALLRGLVKGGEVFGQGSASGVIGHDVTRRTPRSIGDLPPGLASTPAPAGHRAHSLLFFLLLLAAALAVLVIAVKHGRRRLRYLTRDPRRIAVACARELTEYLNDQRLPAGRTATFNELGGTVTDTFGVDGGRFARAATAARYGLPGEARGAALTARAELRTLKRKLRRSLSTLDRVRGLLSVRSLGLG